jgi:hypothetical protein
VNREDQKRGEDTMTLRLADTGPGSRAAIVEYVREVIEQRTTVNDDTTAERLAGGIVTSILSRLGAGYTIATGEPGPDVKAVRDCDGDIWIRSDPSPSGLVGWYRSGIGIAKPWSVVARYYPLTDASHDDHSGEQQ